MMNLFVKNIAQLVDWWRFFCWSGYT